LRFCRKNVLVITRVVHVHDVGFQPALLWRLVQTLFDLLDQMVTSTVEFVLGETTVGVETNKVRRFCLVVRVETPFRRIYFGKFARNGTIAVLVLVDFDLHYAVQADPQ
jgi:hypothetical protein